MEQTIYRGRTSLIKYWYLVGMGGLMIMTGVQLINSPGAFETGFLFLIPGILFVGAAFLCVRRTSYTVTSQRVIQRTGLFSPRASQVPFSEIRHIQVDQDHTERLLGIGNIVVTATRPTGRKVVFPGIRSPGKVADMIPGRRIKAARPGPRPGPGSGSGPGASVTRL
ncbi:MAG: PH domain-containing protein [bacterium]|nr:PH domain-containing protein [bacterium]MCP5068941.1 PH domain-containing protein [bacterium]